MMDVDYVRIPIKKDKSLTEDDTRYITYGRVTGILPYMIQDGYNRKREEIDAPVVILKNEYIEAEFLPWMGGRLWSLKYKGRELLFKNESVQPCNLALRNAWCSGGVEWNVGIRGHSMLTCESLFTEIFELPDGTAGVRFYEYERIRGIVYRIEAYLPPMSHLLFVQITLENPKGNGETAMYWWSNAAVACEENTRVLAPGRQAVVTQYKDEAYYLSRCNLPLYKGMSVSDPYNLPFSLDVFFDLPPESQKMIVALHEGKRGLLHLSTDFLYGRKLFAWGRGQGGRHWQSFLAPTNEQPEYIEIQAGITLTQQDHIPMPEGAVWSWLEAYGELTCDINGLDYYDAVNAACKEAQTVISKQNFEAERLNRGSIVAKTVGTLVHKGEGWGALENLRRKKEGLSPLSDICKFSNEEIGTKQLPFLSLLNDGEFPCPSAQTVPYSYITSKKWLDIAENKFVDNWFFCYHLAIMRFANGDHCGAKEMFKRSIELCPNAWAYRCLARLSKISGENKHLEYYNKALELIPNQINILLEYYKNLLEDGLYEALLYKLEQQPDYIKTMPRMEFYRAIALTEVERFDEAEKILNKPLVIPDIREGELGLSNLWFRLHEKKTGLSIDECQKRYPLPYELDFRMH
jgi:tetratricopeptide (TPR) repeat protein